MFARKRQMILEILAENREWLSGREIVKRSNGIVAYWNVYLLLHELADEGLVAVREDELRKTLEGVSMLLYRITEDGLRQPVSILAQQAKG